MMFLAVNFLFLHFAKVDKRLEKLLSYKIDSKSCNSTALKLKGTVALGVSA